MKTFAQISTGFGFILLAFATGASAAEPTSNWNSTPSWAQNNRASQPSQIVRSFNARERLRESDLAPFSPGSNNLALELGQIFLMGDLASQYDNKLGARIHYTYGVSDMFAFDSSFGHSSHSDGKFGMTTLLTGLRTNLAWIDRVIPHLVFGLGFYRPSYQVTPVQSISPVLFGLHLGPGIDLAISRQVFFGTSLTFHSMFGSTEQTAKGPLSVGGTFTTFLIRAGATF